MAFTEPRPSFAAQVVLMFPEETVVAGSRSEFHSGIQPQPVDRRLAVRRINAGCASVLRRDDPLLDPPRPGYKQF